MEEFEKIEDLDTINKIKEEAFNTKETKNES